MKSVSAVYARLDRAARGVADGNLSAWMAQRTYNVVQEAIKHGLRMANDPDYRLGVEADRFARQEYEAAFPGVMGLGRAGDKHRALTEGAMLLRAGRGSEVGGVALRREVERLRAEMRAEIDALRAPAPTPVAPVPVAPTETKTRAKIVNLGVKRFGVEVDGVITGRFVFNRTQSKYGPQTYAAYTDPTTGEEIAIGYKFFDEMKRAMLEKFGALAPTDTRRFPVQGFAASTLDAEADGLRDFPDEDDGDEDDAAIRAVVRAYEAGKRKALVVSRAEADAVIAGLTVLANAEDEQAEAERKRPVSKRDPERARMTRAASDGLSALSTRIFKAFR